MQLALFMLPVPSSHQSQHMPISVVFHPLHDCYGISELPCLPGACGCGCGCGSGCGWYTPHKPSVSVCVTNRGYEESMDPELQDMFNLVVSKGINLFDTADSYGTGRLNGRSEQLLGQFIRYEHH